MHFHIDSKWNPSIIPDRIPKESLYKPYRILNRIQLESLYNSLYKIILGTLSNSLFKLIELLIELPIVYPFRIPQRVIDSLSLLNPS